MCESICPALKDEKVKTALQEKMSRLSRESEERFQSAREIVEGKL